MLERENGNEKYPGFELYSVIAKDIRDAIPEMQISHMLFKQFENKDTKVQNSLQYIVF